MQGYTKLFGSIVASTIWNERNETRIVWITMLALANKDGIVEGSLPGLATLSRVSLEDCKSAVEALSSPDEFSRTKDLEGRRIAPVDGGWKVLNHAKYRAKMNADERREYLRLKQQEHREKNRQPVNTASTSVNKCQLGSTRSTQSEAEAESKKDPYLAGNGSAKPPPTPREPRPRNELMDALAIASDIPVSEIGGCAARLQKVLRSIKASSPDVTASEIQRRAANYHSHFSRECTLTPEALGKHWSLCHAPKHTIPQSGHVSPEFEERLNAF